MNFAQIKSIGQYTKTQAYQTHWKLKKQSGNLTGHSMQLRDYLNPHSSISSLNHQKDDDNIKLEAIMNKAKSGKKLSEADWEYLRQKNPQMYDKLKAVVKETEQYEKDLRSCSTRDQAQRLHLMKLGQILSELKNGDDTAIIKAAYISRSTEEFTKSEVYKQLPTEAEEAIKRAEEQQERFEQQLRELEESREHREEIQEARAEEEREHENTENLLAEDDADSEAALDAQGREIAEKEKAAKAAAGRKRKKGLEDYMAGTLPKGSVARKSGEQIGFGGGSKAESRESVGNQGAGHGSRAGASENTSVGAGIGASASTGVAAYRSAVSGAGSESGTSTGAGHSVDARG